MNFRIVSDSSSNVFHVEGLSYTTVPMKIVAGDKEFVDNDALDLQGMVDFLAVANCLMQADYRGTFTLESPVIRPDGADIPKLAESLQFLHRMIRGSRRDA